MRFFVPALVWIEVDDVARPQSARDLVNEFLSTNPAMGLCQEALDPDWPKWPQGIESVFVQMGGQAGLETE